MKLFALLITIFLSINTLAAADVCAGFYQRFYDSNKQFGLQAFKLNMDRLEDRFESIGTKLKAISSVPTATMKKPYSNEDEAILIAKANLFLRSDVRITFFKLQSLARIYAKHYDDPFFESKGAFFKKYEDLIGKVDLWNTMWDLSVKIKEPRLQAHFLELKLDATVDMLVEMESSGLIDSPKSVFRAHLEELNHFKDWKKPKKDLAIQYKQIAKELRKLDEKIKVRTFTQDDIELGLHELRRRLRWPLIHTQVFNRLTQYDTKSKLPESVQTLYTQLATENPNLLKSSFLKMDTADIENPLLIPFIPYAMMTELVSMIGVKKDKAEGDIYFSEAMAHLGFSAKEVSRVEGKILKATERTEKFDHKALSDKVQADLDASGLLRTYADLLEKLNEE